MTIRDEKWRHDEDKRGPLPKFGEWDVNDPKSAEGFTFIFNKARDEKKTGGKPDSPSPNRPRIRNSGSLAANRPQQHRRWLCCVYAPDAQG